MEEFAQIGSIVEVVSATHYQNKVVGPVYFSGTILNQENDGKLVVEYVSPFASKADEDPLLLRNSLELARLRPLPPLRVPTLTDFEDVDVFMKTAWRNGHILRTCSHDKTLVHINELRKSKEVLNTSLRTHLEWINNQWLPPDIHPPAIVLLPEQLVKGKYYRRLMDEMCELLKDGNLNATEYEQIREKMNRSWGILPIGKFSEVIAALKLRTLGFTFNVDCLNTLLEAKIETKGFEKANRPGGFSFVLWTDAQISEEIEKMDELDLDNGERLRRRALEFERFKRKTEEAERIRQNTLNPPDPSPSAEILRIEQLAEERLAKEVEDSKLMLDHHLVRKD